MERTIMCVAAHILLRAVRVVYARLAKEFTFSRFFFLVEENDKSRETMPHTQKKNV